MASQAWQLFPTGCPTRWSSFCLFFRIAASTAEGGMALGLLQRAGEK